MEEKSDQQFKRSTALKEQPLADKLRHGMYKPLHLNSEPTTANKLPAYLR